MNNFDAIKYGFYVLMTGIQPKYYKRDMRKSYEEGWGLFKGKKVEPSRFVKDFLLPTLDKTRLTHLRSLINKINYKIISRFYTT